MKTDKLAPVHPGEVLLEEFLKPLNLSQNRLALNSGGPSQRMWSYFPRAWANNSPTSGDSTRRPMSRKPSNRVSIP